VDALWQRCMDDFLRSKYARSGSESTIVNYKSVLHHFFAGGLHPERVTRHDVEEFVGGLTYGTRSRGRPPSPSTRNMRLNVLSSFYTYASTYTVYTAADGPVPLYRFANPTVGLQFSKIRPVYRAFSEVDLARFFEVIPRDTMCGIRDRALFLTFFLTARRAREIARLCYGDLSEGIVTNPDGTMRSAHLYRYIGKGSGGVYATAELPDLAYRAIVHYLRESGRLQHMEADSPLWLPVGRWPTSPIDPYRPISSHTINESLKRYADAAHLDARRLSLHSFRHSSARERYVLNPDVRAVQQVLGHKSIATTDIYIRDLISTSDPVAKLLEERFSYLY